jgi:TolB-like protein/DNA-binding winged helix-turn-helix (wHTH) protein/Flp pilus assembly protein TadD
MNNEYQGRVLVFGDYRFDVDDGRLSGVDNELTLTPTQQEILLTLIRHAGRIVGKSKFLDNVWPGRIVEEGTLARNVSTLRKVLKDNPRDPRLIETVPGRGYRFVARVTEMPADSVHRPAIAQSRWRPRAWSRAMMLGGAGPVLLVIAASVLLALSGIDVQRTAPIRSLVVLPFENLSGDSAQTYIAEGITEELISTLGKIGDLSVTSRTSSLNYLGSSKTLPEIASELGVEGVVEGSVLRAGDSLRLSIRLVDAASDSSLWSETFDRKLSDARSMYNEIALAVAAAIDVDLSPEQARLMGVETPVDEVANEAYLLGLFFKNKSTVEALHTALSYFEQAIEAEPGFAHAYAAMADTYLMLASWQGPSRELWPKARAAADAAIELDSDVALAHLVRAGALLCHDLDYLAAEPIFLRALELNPNNTMSIARYSYSLMSQGRFEESIEWARQAVRLDPVSVELNTALGERYFFAGHFDEAKYHLEHSLALDPSYARAHRALGWLYLEAGMQSEAILALEKAFALGSGQGVAGELGRAYALAGRFDDARKLLHTLEDLSLQGRDSAYSIALIYEGLGHSDLAFEWLERAFGERDFRMIFLRVDPIWDDLRSDPRFQELLVRIGHRPPAAA